jgi:hypothetical protein
MLPIGNRRVGREDLQRRLGVPLPVKFNFLTELAVYDGFALLKKKKPKIKKPKTNRKIRAEALELLSARNFSLESGSGLAPLELWESNKTGSSCTWPA